MSPPAPGAGADADRPARPQAFILTGAFWVVVRDPIYLTEVSRRGLRILLVTAARWREQALTCIEDPNHPASAVDDIAFVAGEVETEGTFTPGVIGAARTWRESYDVVGVYAVGETMVEPSGLLADALGLPFPGLRACRATRSKYLQRWYLPEFSPHSVLLPAGGRDTTRLDGTAYPAVIKPAARHSSSGVELVRDRAELDTALAGLPERETVLVEELVTGQEYSVESLVQHGETIFSWVTVKETTQSDSRAFVELGHTVAAATGPGPSSAAAILLPANQRLLERLAFEDGITHAEWRVTGSGAPVLMEVAARTPGDGLMALYRLATGEAMEPEILRIALGEPADYPQPRRCARQVYLDHQPGVLRDVTLEWSGVEPVWIGEAGLWPELTAAAADPPTLRAVFVVKSRGRRLTPLRSSGDRAVTFFIDAPTLSELDILEQRVRAAISVDTAPDPRSQDAPVSGRPDRGEDMSETTSTALATIRSQLVAHSLYSELTTVDELRTFMKHHVFAVWDFFTLLKRLQAEVTTVTLPWRPAPHAEHGRFVAEIVLAEETDDDIGGGYISHFELYLRAMAELGADTAPIQTYLDALAAGVDPITALDHPLIPPGVRRFTEHTLSVALHGARHEVASSFCHGREILLPDVFTAVRTHLGEAIAAAPTFRHYIDRHITLDHHEHGPLALKLLVALCEGDPDREAEAERTAVAAIEARIALWDGVLDDIHATAQPQPI